MRALSIGIPQLFLGNVVRALGLSIAGSDSAVASDWDVSDPMISTRRPTAHLIPLSIVLQIGRDDDQSHDWKRLRRVGVGAFWALLAGQAHRKRRVRHD